MENRSMFVGLDVHKETLDVSIAEGHGSTGRATPVAGVDMVCPSVCMWKQPPIWITRDERRSGEPSGIGGLLGIWRRLTSSCVDQVKAGPKTGRDFG